MARHRVSGAAMLFAWLCLVLPTPGQTAEQDTQQWTTFSASFPQQDSKWSFSLWSQIRFNDDIGRFNWLLINPSAHYKLKDGWKVGFGYQYIVKNKSHDEQMPWQEISLSTKFDNRLVVGNRLRLEERMINDISGVIFRARYRVNASYPLGGSGYYLTGSEALWVNLNQQSSGPTSGFDQNRLFGGIGTHVGNHWRMEAGYQWRYKDNGGGESNSDHILMLQFFYSAKGKAKAEPIPAESHL
jgi:hypothetical protein